MTRRRVAVTGLGIVCPIGNTVDEAWQNALAGKSGVTRITKFDPARLACQIAGEVKGFDVAPYMSPKDARRMDTFIHYGMAAGLQAWRDCGLQVTPENAERVGINFGSGIGGLPLIEEMHNELNKNGPRRISPFFIPGTIINMIAGLLSIELGAKGPNLAMVTACTTSTHCIGEAGKSIRYGEADVMIAGGAEAVVSELAIGGFAAARALSTRNDDPATASRPWDKERDGFVLGEGSGAMVLEEWEHAKARGAKIYCELTGYGVSADAHHMTAPPDDVDQVHDRAPARRGRGHRGGLHRARVARPGLAADHQPAQPGPAVRSRLRAECGTQDADPRRAVQLVRLRRDQRQPGLRPQLNPFEPPAQPAAFILHRAGRTDRRRPPCRRRRGSGSAARLAGRAARRRAGRAWAGRGVEPRPAALAPLHALHPDRGGKGHGGACGR